MTLTSDSVGRGMVARWRCRAVSEPGQAGRGQLIERVLAARGLTDRATAAAFLTPSLHGLHDPSLMPGLDAAAQRILAALDANETIAVYGDYDVDGITASAIMLRTLRAIKPGARVVPYVPHRIDEGYGLNADAIAALAGEGVRVIITVDCGITATAPARAARDLGVDLIITDHHHAAAHAGEPLPCAFAIVHPRLPGAAPAYPFGDLCGAGVAYKLAWRLVVLASGGDRASAALRAMLVELLAFAALGTVADVVPLLGENRVITRFGLSRCKHSPYIGLRALVEASGLAGENIDAESVGFKLGPRLNAIGRLGHAREAVELLTTEDTARATEIAERLSRVNEQRQAESRRVQEEALARAESAGMASPARRGVVLADASWHPGVVGIACARLAERLCRPVVLMNIQAGPDGPVCVGSGRSVPGFNLHGAIAACAPLLLRFGGHDAAAGLALAAENLGAFTDAFIEQAHRFIGPEDLIATAWYDTEARLEELTPSAVARLDALAPFGRDNPPVRVRLRNARLAERPRVMGKTGEHVSLRLTRDDGPGGASLRVVAWGWADRVRDLHPGMAVEAILVPKNSAWNGQTRCEPELVDLAVVPRSDADAAAHSTGALA